MIKRREAIRLLTAAGAIALANRPALAFAQTAPEPSPPLLALFPLNVVLLPGNTLPLHIFEPRYREMIQECIDTGAEFGVLRMAGDKIRAAGCTARITDVIHRYHDGRMDILTRGERRFRIDLPNQPGRSSLRESDLNSGRSFFRGQATFLQDEASAGDGEELTVQALALWGKLMGLIAADDAQPSPPQRPPAASHPQLSFQLMDGLPAEVSWKQELLELGVERERLVRVVLHLQHLIQLMEEDSNTPAPQQAALRD